MNYRYLLSLLIATTCAFNVQAESINSDRWFDIELLVFKRNVDIHKIREQLNQNDVYLKKRKHLEVLKALAITNCSSEQLCLHKQNPVQITKNEIINGDHRLTLLDSSHLQFTKQRQKLEEHGLFKPLMHLALRMPVQSRKNALPIHLFAGENYALDIHENEISELKDQKIAIEANTQGINAITQAVTADITNITQLGNDTEKLDVLASLQKEKIIKDLYEIDGNLLIYVERYLYVDGQLIIRTETEKEMSATPHATLANQATEQGDSHAVEILDQEAIIKDDLKTETVVTETLFDQKRRLRSEEIHYLDHPLFGVIVQIRKIPADELAILDAKSKARAAKQLAELKTKAAVELKKISITQ